jgi:hypothetical protein
MARIVIQDLVVDEALDAKALGFVWGGAGPRPLRPAPLARELSSLLDRALARRSLPPLPGARRPGT